MRILSIETSCDETAIALIEASGGLRQPKFKILKNLVSSQIAVHRPFGGVVPNLAKREHLRNLPIIFKKIIGSKFQNLNSKLPDLLAVTVGPGLEPALWTGINFAKKIRQQFKIPLIGVNHLEGHLYSFLLSKKTANPKSETRNPKRLRFRNLNFVFPAVQLLVSGGHTILVLMKSLTNWKKLGETRDDAVGEAFDKVAKMLHLSYPGGPEIEKLANYGLAKTIDSNYGLAKTIDSKTIDSKTIDFPRPMIAQKNYDFSFSGLKTSVLYYLRDHKNASKRDVAASFQQAAIDVLTSKTMQAVKEFDAKSVILSGGVAANKSLRQELSATSRKLGINFLSADIKFQTDNAAMIAVAAYIQYLRKKNRAIRAQANLNL